ncbi:hypothetical protein MMC06_002556 [Schaereria dolodes]|nr:hypothetical protein [Schaereria dolodes]
MTPSKTKKPLPTSKSTIFHEHPTTYAQWRIALAQVKLFYMNRQWKECIARCGQLLDESKSTPHPVHATYLHYYSALSNEIIAQSLHNLSTAKLPLLISAKNSYLAASLSLPKLDKRPKSDRSTLTSTSKVSPGSTPSHSHPSTSTPHDPFIDSPSPPPRNTNPTSKNKTPTNEIKYPLLLLYPSPYTTALLSFASMLQSHLTAIDSHIKATEEAQRDRYAAKRTVSHGDDEATKLMDRKRRIDRGRENGWKRERFVREAERIRGVCARAVEEMG